MSTNGNFVWYDLVAADVDAAKKFYSTLVGWDTQVFEAAPADDPYEMWMTSDGPVGGMMPLPDVAKAAGAPPHWLAYTGVEDAAATTKKVTALGGEVLLPVTAIPGDGGQFAIFRDPQGAVFGVVAGSQANKRSAEVGKITWHELMATDHEKALTFYGDVFGWRKGNAMDMGPAGIYQLYDNGGKALGGMFDKPAQAPGPAAWVLYISVADCDASTEKAKALGATVIHGPMDVPDGGRIVQLLDPQGAMIALHATVAK